MKWFDGSCSWEPRKNILDDELIEDLRRDYRGLNWGVEIVRTRRTKGGKTEDRVHFIGRPSRELPVVAAEFGWRGSPFSAPLTVRGRSLGVLGTSYLPCNCPSLASNQSMR